VILAEINIDLLVEKKRKLDYHLLEMFAQEVRIEKTCAIMLR